MAKIRNVQNISISTESGGTTTVGNIINKAINKALPASSRAEVPTSPPRAEGLRSENRSPRPSYDSIPNKALVADDYATASLAPAFTDVGPSPPHAPPSSPAARPVDVDLLIRTVESAGQLVLEYQIHSPTGAADLHHETIRSKALQNPDAFKASLYQQLSQLHGGKTAQGKALLADEIERDLEALGHLLYRRLFPEPMRDAYRRFRHVESVRITSDEPWIPWEFVKSDEDNDDFFCLQFRLSRWVAETPPVAAIRIARLAVIEGAESAQAASLAEAGTEMAILEDLGQAGGVEVDRYPQACFEQLDSLLREGGRELYHFVGHGEFDAEQPDESRLLMGERAFKSHHLMGAIARQLQRDRPMIFASACDVGQQGWSLTGLGGWAESWVRECGCSVFIGPQWSVNSVRAKEYAGAFYRHLREGQPLGEAVRKARRELKAKFPGKIDWLAYSLYGHPNAQVAFGQARFPQVPSSPNVLVNGRPGNDGLFSRLHGKDPEVAITEPRNGATVPERPPVAGTVADSSAVVWVVVHPIEISDFWVQPRPIVEENGAWRTVIHIGRPGAVDLDKRFEIAAVINPQDKLHEGQVLSYWPVAEARSKVIRVTRRN